MLARARAQGARRCASSGPTRWRCPTPSDSFDAATVGFGARNFADLRARHRGDGARRAARRARRDPRDHAADARAAGGLLPRTGSTGSCRRSGALAGERAAYSYLPSSVRRFPAPRELAAVMDGCGLRADPLRAAGRGHHRDPRRRGRVRELDDASTSTPSTRCSSSAASRCARRWPTSRRACARSPRSSAHSLATVAAGGKRLRPLLVFVAGLGSEARVDAVARRRRGRADPLGDARPRRRARRRAAAPRPPHRATPRPAATPRRRPATCCSRAPSPSSRATATIAQLRALSAASAALARGELMQRADAWRADVTLERYLAALRAEDRAPVRRRLRARRARRRRAAARPVRPRRRARLPAARRRARHHRARASAPASAAAPTCSTAPSRCR